jgi:hypothetical protein
MMEYAAEPRTKLSNTFEPARVVRKPADREHCFAQAAARASCNSYVGTLFTSAVSTSLDGKAVRSYLKLRQGGDGKAISRRPITGTLGISPPQTNVRIVILRDSQRREHGAVTDFKLLKDVVKMHLDGAVGNIQPSSDFLVR